MFESLAWSAVLPAKRNDYAGSRVALYLLGAIACLLTFRGCVHYFAADGGAGIIAGIPLDTYPQGAVQSIVNAFGVFGIGHLLQAALVWLVLFRYRALIPLVFVCLFATQLLAVVLMHVKPLPVVPPGQIGVYVMLPASALLFLLSIRAPAVAPHSAVVSPVRDGRA